MDLANKKVKKRTKKRFLSSKQMKNITIVLLEVFGRALMAGVVLFSIPVIDYRWVFPLEWVDLIIIQVITGVFLVVWAYLPMLTLEKGFLSLKPQSDNKKVKE